MDGLGNDFVIIDQRTKNIEFSKKQIIKICDRDFIGCDQLIIIKKNKKFDAGLEFYNSDGSTSGACGNGTRCVAYFLSKENNKKEINVWTSSATLKSIILNNNLVDRFSRQIILKNIVLADVPWRFRSRLGGCLVAHQAQLRLELLGLFQQRLRVELDGEQ